MPERSDDYRKKQAECVEQAKKARTSADKTQWLRIGEEWAKLADAGDNAAQSNNPAPQPSEQRASK